MLCFSLQTPAQSEHTCEYLYSVEQSGSTGNAEDSITVTATVQVTCESSELLFRLVVVHIAIYLTLDVGGTYGSSVATRYCMTIDDVDGSFLRLGLDNDSDGRYTR